MENNTVISIQNLIKQFPVGREFFTALKNITLDLHKGEFTGLVGPSGWKNNFTEYYRRSRLSNRRKSPRLRSTIDNTTHNERARLRRKYMGFIFQSYNLLPVYTVFENVELPLILNKMNKKIEYRK